MDWSIDLPVIVATLASITFTVLFGVRSRWNSNPVGRMQFSVSVSLSVVFVLIFVNIVTNNYFLREPIRHVVYWSLALALCYQVRTLLLVQAGKIKGPNYGRRSDDHVKKTPTNPEGIAAQVKE